MHKNPLALGCLIIFALNVVALGNPGVGEHSQYPLKLSPPLLAHQVLQVDSANVGATNSDMASRRILPFRAFIQSLVIPGWGQRYVGKGTSIGTITFVADIALWSTVVGLSAYGNWKEDMYQTYASAHADVDNRDKDHQYYVDIGNYINTNQYNEQQRRDRDFDELYLSSSDWWEWDSNDNRLEFKTIRIQSDNALNDRYYVLGAIFLNHLFSAIHASRQAGKLKHSATQAFNPSPSIELAPELGFGSFGLRLTRRF